MLFMSVCILVHYFEHQLSTYKRPHMTSHSFTMKKENKLYTLRLQPSWLELHPLMFFCHDDKL